MLPSQKLRNKTILVDSNILFKIFSASTETEPESHLNQRSSESLQQEDQFLPKNYTALRAARDGYILLNLAPQR